MVIDSKDGVKVYKSAVRAVLVFLAGGIIFHIVVMMIDYYLMLKPFDIIMREDFMSNIFSKPMWPMMAVYGLLSLGLYLLWNRIKRAALALREKELQREKAEAVLRSLQRLTGIMSENIASQNSEIVSWLALRKRLGHPVPAEVENPSNRIGEALQSLSELTYIVPYTGNFSSNTREFEKILCEKLTGNSGAASAERANRGYGSHQ